MIVDVNCFLGPWPFAPHPRRSSRQLAAYMASHGVDGALVSPLAAAFLPEPMAANRELIAALRGQPSLVPVPVVNPKLANWREQIDALETAVPHRLVRILPGYHNYRLNDVRLKPFMAELAARKTFLIVQARMEDERNGYFGLKLPAFKAAHLTQFLGAHPKQHVLCCGLYRHEIEAANRVCRNFSADYSFAESLHTVESLRELLPADRILVGTMTPLLSAAAQIEKLRHAHLPARERRMIGAGNARRLLLQSKQPGARAADRKNLP